MFSGRSATPIRRQAVEPIKAKPTHGARDNANPGAEAVRAKADAHAASVMEIIEAIRVKGIIGLTSIARELTRRGVPTARGGRWNASRVRALLARVMD